MKKILYLILGAIFAFGAISAIQRSDKMKESEDAEISVFENFDSDPTDYTRATCSGIMTLNEGDVLRIYGGGFLTLLSNVGTPEETAYYFDGEEGRISVSNDAETEYKVKDNFRFVRESGIFYDWISEEWQPVHYDYYVEYYISNEVKATYFDENDIKKTVRLDLTQSFGIDDASKFVLFRYEG